MKKSEKDLTNITVKKCVREGENNCDTGSDCNLVEAERELAMESLKAHLSEQRHDFFNLLQVLYGYTQLKKPDKVLAHIKDYCRQMENIGRLYNCKCIKLADLLYTKGKEAESIDMKLMVSAEVSFDPVIRMLEDEAVLKAVDYTLSGFLHVLDQKGFKNAHLVYNLEEDADTFRMEVFCGELGEGHLEPVSFMIPGQVLYWKKIERDVMDFDNIAKHCSDNGFDGRMLEDGMTFLISIRKK
ncbi:MAG TPA: Spo0B domain-containing protein [Clostridia bacterium]|nr:Spo0B domain-containing protein [Clostridia bacterium]